MNIHEYQSKQILRQYGLHVPEGYPAFTVEDAVQSAKRLDTPVVVVKAQIHPGFPRYVTSHLTAFPQLSIFRSSQQRYNP